MKPCPFCGSSKIDAICEGATSTPYFYAYCEQCDASGPAIAAEKMDDEEGESLALQKWDERVAA